MSGFAAAIAWDGADPAAELETMIAASPHRSSGGTAAWTGDGVALACLAHRGRAPRIARERSGPHVVVFDGHLYNSDELIARLSLERDSDDSSVPLAAIARFGEDAPALLDGDFALLGWDARTRTLVAARDAMGMRPLYWTRKGHVLLLASEIPQLLAALGAVPDPDVTALADFIAFEPPSDARTVFSGIQRVPPGHVLVATPDALRTRCYWRPEPMPPGPPRSDDEYAEECRELLNRAVRARLRASTRPVLFFSGGVDSSCILATAIRVAPAIGASVPQPLSLRFDMPGGEESDFRAAFAAAMHVTTEEIPADPPAADEYAAQARRRAVPPDLPGQFMGRGLRRRAAELDADIVFTGEGGDAVFGGSTFGYADLLRAGRWGSAWRQFRIDRTYDDAGWSPFGLVTDGVWPLLPAAARRQLRVPLKRPTGAGAGPPWLRIPPTDRAVVPDPPRGVAMASWAIARDLNRGWTSYFLESLERDAAEWALEMRHPLYDRRLVEFALSLPEEQRRRGDVTKFVLRQAARLPPAVGARTSKAELGSALTSLLAALGGRAFFERLRLAEAGWVDAAEACRGYDVVCAAASPADRAAGTLVARLWLLASIEVWFRACYDRSAL